MSSGKRNFGLDLVRAIAISLVLIAHFAKTQEYFGFFGVELFFGLSGFLIGQILWRNYSLTYEWSLSQMINFWSRRWWRTLPNYYLFLFVSLIYTYFMAGALPSLREFADFVWFGQDLLSRNHGFYGVSWSLCIEEWFYLLFPLILFAFSKFKLNMKVTFLLSLVLFFVAFPFIRMVLMREGKGSDLREITFARLDAIAYGVVMAYVQKNINLNVKKSLLLFSIGAILMLMPIIIILLSSVTLETLRQNPYLLTIVPIGASFILPLASLIKAPTGKLIFVSVITEKMSLWSYSIYLSHMPILFLMYYLMNDVRDTTVGNLASKIVGLLVTIGISAIIYQYFEVPFTNKRPRELKPYPLRNEYSSKEQLKSS